MKKEVAELERRLKALCASHTALEKNWDDEECDRQDEPQKAAENHQRAEMELRGKADYEKRVKEALKERNKQRNDEVRDLPNELQRVREGEQSKSSCTESEDHLQKSEDYPQKSACGSLEDVNEKTMGTRIEET